MRRVLTVYSSWAVVGTSFALAGCVASEGTRPLEATVRRAQVSDRAIATVEENAQAANEATRNAALVRRFPAN